MLSMLHSRCQFFHRGRGDISVDALCHFCGSNSLSFVERYKYLPRVTSDSKPFAAGGKLATCKICDLVVPMPLPF